MRLKTMSPVLGACAYIAYYTTSAPNKSACVYQWWHRLYAHVLAFDATNWAPAIEFDVISINLLMPYRIKFRHTLNEKGFKT